MSIIKSIAVIGAGGNIGKAVLPLLQAASFDITVISRKNSTSTFPSDVRSIKCDYSPDRLTEALHGQDAVLCLINSDSTDFEAVESVIVDAAGAAGVKFFVPSEFGHDTTDERVVSHLPLFEAKNRIISRLRQKEVLGMTWTGVITGGFFDWAMSLGVFDIDIRRGTARIWDSGNTRFCATNLSSIARALVTLLSDPSAREAAKNRHVHICSIVTSQNEILQQVEIATGRKFQVSNVKSHEIKKEAQDKLHGADVASLPMLQVPILQYLCLGEEGLDQWTEKAEWGNRVLLQGKKDSVGESIRRVVEQMGQEQQPSFCHSRLLGSFAHIMMSVVRRFRKRDRIAEK
ncbi:MAG: hypothetical protein Q9227_004033 [Pyrenula ochraceoflavens]